jgi:RNA polymerase sigma factor for flagellar operon FliA
MDENLRPLWVRFRARRDPNLREQLIREAIYLVRKVARGLSYRLPRHLELDDLEAAGTLGLLHAVETYDPEKGAEFSTYAQARIRGAILDDLRSLDLLPRSLREKARDIEQTTARLEQQFLRVPEDREVADGLGMELEAYHRVLIGLRASLHASLEDGSAGRGEEKDGRRSEVAADDRATDPWGTLALKERRVLLGEMVAQMPAHERTVLTLYYFKELSMKKISTVLKVSESRVSQIHSAALRRIRLRLRQRLVGIQAKTGAAPSMLRVRSPWRGASVGASRPGPHSRPSVGPGGASGRRAPSNASAVSSRIAWEMV